MEDNAFFFSILRDKPYHATDARFGFREKQDVFHGSPCIRLVDFFLQRESILLGGQLHRTIGLQVVGFEAEELVFLKMELGVFNDILAIQIDEGSKILAHLLCAYKGKQCKTAMNCKDGKKDFGPRQAHILLYADMWIRLRIMWKSSSPLQAQFAKIGFFPDLSTGRSNSLNIKVNSGTWISESGTTTVPPPG
jgi:hypothetical protein